jgi:hypothetical protein
MKLFEVAPKEPSMKMRNWLKSLSKSVFSNRGSRRVAARPSTALTVESLESRETPSTFTVSVTATSLYGAHTEVFTVKAATKAAAFATAKYDFDMSAWAQMQLPGTFYVSSERLV